MFTSVVECILRPHEKERFDEVLRGHILRSLRKHPGFVGLLAIASDARGERMFAVTVWRTRADADRYEKGHLAELVNILKPLVVQGSEVRWASADSLNEIERGSGVDCTRDFSPPI
jgi:heme-degrading monooxygenase HmoA